MAFVVRLAVTTGTVELAEVVGLRNPVKPKPEDRETWKKSYIEARDRDRAGAVVLNDLVLGMERAPADDIWRVARAGLLDGERVLANVLPPDVANRAGSLAVDALRLVLADDDVADFAARFDDENGVVLSRLCLALALAAWARSPSGNLLRKSRRQRTAALAVILVHLAVEHLASLDGARGGKSDIAGRFGERSGNCTSC
jgi:hypothetical protein